MGMSFHCHHEKRMDKIQTGIIQCKVDDQICLHQQYCPSKRCYEITASYKKCGKLTAGDGNEKQTESCSRENDDM